jgi:dienelactone hydrolase
VYHQTFLYQYKYLEWYIILKGVFVMKKLLMIVILLLIPFALAAQESDEMEFAQQFAYEQDASLDIEEVSTEMRGDVTIRDLTFRSPASYGPLSAYLVLPPGEGPFPAVLYVHWYEPEAPDSNRTEFLEEAVAFAEEGVVSLLVETMWSEPTWYRQGRTLNTDYGDAIDQVMELRRALDVLVAQPQVDADRIAYVGHDFGAMYGSVMGAVDHRPVAYVLIAGASNFNHWMLFGIPETRPGLDAYKTRMDELAPSRFVSQLNAPVLFQFGTEDFYTPQEDFEAFFAAAADPKEIKTYETEHAMALPEIRADRLAFLRQQLGLPE